MQDMRNIVEASNIQQFQPEQFSKSNRMHDKISNHTDYHRSGMVDLSLLTDGTPTGQFSVPSMRIYWSAQSKL